MVIARERVSRLSRPLSISWCGLERKVKKRRDHSAPRLVLLYRLRASQCIARHPTDAAKLRLRRMIHDAVFEPKRPDWLKPAAGSPRNSRQDAVRSASIEVGGGNTAIKLNGMWQRARMCGLHRRDARSKRGTVNACRR